LENIRNKYLDLLRAKEEFFLNVGFPEIYIAFNVSKRGI